MSPNFMMIDLYVILSVILNFELEHKVQSIYTTLRAHAIGMRFCFKLFCDDER